MFNLIRFKFKTGLIMVSDVGENVDTWITWTVLEFAVGSQ